MDVEIKRVVVSERQRGVALLLAIIEYPECKLPGEYFEKYYTAMCDSVREWLRECEIPRVRSEFSNMTDGLMLRFARYDYRLKCSVTCVQDAIVIECNFNYLRGGVLIKQSMTRQIWSKSDGLMLRKMKKS